MIGELHITAVFQNNESKLIKYIGLVILKISLDSLDGPMYRGRYAPEESCNPKEIEENTRN
jgi:hypothetical protein